MFGIYIQIQKEALNRHFESEIKTRVNTSEYLTCFTNLDKYVEHLLYEGFLASGAFLSDNKFKLKNSHLIIYFKRIFIV